MSMGILELFDKVSVTEAFAKLLENTSLEGCKLYIEENRAEVKLKSSEFIDRFELFKYKEAVKKIYNLLDLTIYVIYSGLKPTYEYFKGLINMFLYENTACRICLSTANARYSDGYLKIDGIRGGKELLIHRHFEDYIKNTAAKELDLNVDIDLCFEKFNTEEYMEEREKQQKELAAAAAAEVRREQPAYEKAEDSPLLFGKPITDTPMPIIDLTEGMNSCVIEGEVLTVDSRNVKGRNNSHNTIIEFNFGDDKWGCFCKIFSSEERLKRALKEISPGTLLRLRGDYDMDDYARKPLFKVLAAEVLPPKPIRMDNAEEKRVELHMHTKMSAMDAVTSAGDLIKRVAKWGHKAVAVTDHGVAQAFPDAHKAASGVRKSTNPDFKVIYGVEGYLINDMDSAASRLAAIGTEASYVVFDIETTGLKAAADEITEIGAVKIENGKITDRFSQLINPGRPIPPRITELTGITDEMVADMPSIEEVLPKFLDFCTDCVVVAHNAGFDTGFIRQKSARCGLKFNNKIVDTLRLSRELFPENAKHTLDAVAKRLDVSLENHHRAVDDAEATAEIFLKFMQIIKERNRETGEINIDTKPELIKNQKYHIIILAKDYAGLKNLYKLISASNLKYFYRKPIMPKSVIEKHREGLIIGSACEAGELFRAVAEHKPEADLNSIASFYDYLEIQPIGNNRFMVRNGTAADDEALRDYNRKIVELGDRLGLPTVATCDVHFMDPEDEVYRRVLMGGQGFDDADEQAPLYLRTTDEMLEEFSYLGEEKAKEVVITNTNKIADMVELIQPVKDGSYPPSIENCEQDLVDMCHKKAHKIYGDVLPRVVQERMDKELDCIVKYGYSVMYMIAHKLVKKSNEAGYMVGSRGSVGSSFAAFLSDITEVNALCPHYVCPNENCKHSEFFENGEYAAGPDMPDKLCPECGTKMRKDGLTIPFETFLGFKGDKVPDIDLNFSGEYQATAHKYVGELFGEGYVFKAGTIGTIAEKTAIMFAKKYYEAKGIDAPEAELIRVSKGMIDVKRTTGQHPGGIIVCPKTMDIHDFCPIQHPAEKKDSDIITTHFDFHSIHDNLLKLDILGHDDPSTIRMLEDLTGLDAMQIPLDDKKTMSLFSGTEALGVKPDQIGSEVGTLGIPEFGTSFVRGMLVETKPTTFVELLIISGLSHGTDVWLGNAQELIKAKKATLSEVIGLRDDIMVYLIQHGLEPGMAFKIMEFVRKGRAAKEGMLPEYEEAIKAQPSIPGWYLESCKKIKYMFPKAHAAAYVMMAFRIAYFKVNYPVDFYIAYFTVRADLFDATIMTKGVEKVREEMRKISLKGKDKTANEKDLYTILEICQEMYERGIEFLPVDLYKSHAKKFRKIDGKILPPLNAFPGVGDAAAESIAEAAAQGEFISQEDLKNRSGANKAVIEVLEKNGVLKSLPESSQIGMFDM